MTHALLQVAMANGFADFEQAPDRRWWVGLRLSPQAPADFLSAQALPMRPWPGRHWVGRLTEAEMRALTAAPEVEDLELLEAFRLERPPLRRPAGTGTAQPADPALPFGATMPPGTGPVIGVIDDGFPFAHPALTRTVSGTASTRLAALWDQNPRPDFGARARVPDALGYGAVVDRAAMDAALLAAGSASGAQTRCYTAIGYGAVARRRTHGAHVIGLAAGHADWLTTRMAADSAMGLDGAASQQAQQADILAVQLPRELLDSPSRGAVSRAVLDGLVWMLGLCPDRELRVAVPYGSTLGPHDGSSLVERCLEAVLHEAAGRLTLYMPAGNSARWALHARPTAATPAGAVSLRWRLPTGSEAASFVELWAPDGALESVTLDRPDRGASVTVTCAADNLAALPAPDGRPCAHVAHARVPDAGGGLQSSTLMRFGPTQVRDSGRVQAPGGDWILTARLRPDADPTSLHAYGSRARGSFGAAVRGVQGRFVQEVGSGWKIMPEGTVNGMACHGQVQVVGAYVNRWVRQGVPVGTTQPELASRYTASGPGRNARGVDLSLPGDHSESLSGVRSIGTLGAITWRMDGSSVATAQCPRFDDLATLPSKPTTDPRLGKPRVP